MTSLERAWYRKAGWLLLLWPFSLIFQLLIAVRRRHQQHVERPVSHTAPVIVIGNLTVGGTGKTPLLIALVNHFKTQGYTPGVVMRGYGAMAHTFPFAVTNESDVQQSGDEALMISEQTGCPVVIDPDREAAVKHLLSGGEVDLVFSDDGLQHYKLHRDIEIAVVDGQRLFGNGLCLPAGPLREPVSRLQGVDHTVINGEPTTALPELAQASVMHVQPRFLINLLSGERRPIAGAPFNIGNTVQAVAAVGNPERFFGALEALPYPVRRFAFPDHHRFTAADFDTGTLDPQQPIVMTEKDAVKCRAFARANFWSLSVEVEVPETLLSALEREIADCKQQLPS